MFARRHWQAVWLITDLAIVWINRIVVVVALDYRVWLSSLHYTPPNPSLTTKPQCHVDSAILASSAIFVASFSLWVFVICPFKKTALRWTSEVLAGQFFGLEYAAVARPFTIYSGYQVSLCSSKSWSCTVISMSDTDSILCQKTPDRRHRRKESRTKLERKGHIVTIVNSAKRVRPVLGLRNKFW